MGVRIGNMDKEELGDGNETRVVESRIDENIMVPWYTMSFVQGQS